MHWPDIYLVPIVIRVCLVVLFPFSALAYHNFWHYPDFWTKGDSVSRAGVGIFTRGVAESVDEADAVVLRDPDGHWLVLTTCHGPGTLQEPAT